ncbi:MAG TPA: FAD-dependent oxidoreductase [candidate division Zixibacteria bacterium]|nr:FAD-dependent oxidoreductase [candidate division Zixibacteria bacterium]
MSNEVRLETDVVIVGGGGAGIPAAIEAARAGAGVILLEKAESAGGTAAISGGGCMLVGTPLQRSQGISDTPDLAFEDWVRWGQGAADETWARFYIEHTLHDLYHWAESCGVRWVDMKFQEGNRVLRWHRPQNNGLGLMAALIGVAQSLPNVRLMTSVAAGKLLRRDGAVRGVAATHRSGQSFEVWGKAVVVATGGFNSNLDMVLEHRPDLRPFKVLEGSGLEATGSGHRMIGEVGGYFTHMDCIWFYVYATPDYRDPRGRRGLVFRLTPGYIWVNQQGRRFHNESLTGGASATPALLRQNPPHAWAILDTPMTAKMEVADPYYRTGDEVDRAKIQELLDNSPYIRKADTLAELARKIEVDLPTFLGEIERYNRAFDEGLEREPAFGKSLKLSKKFDTPPYYAVQLFPLARKNFGGVKTDLRCRVLDKHFEPIPGLYAAGEVAGMAGGHINGKAGLEGTMLGPSIFSGRVAGAWAAHEAGFGPGFIGKPNRG